MRDLLTSLLDVLGVLLIAAGVAAALQPLIGWPCLAIAGALLLGASQIAARAGRRGSAP
ncbi:hypothetical protein ACFYPX_18145 [Micromonospora zamorensis]|uniref:hypothetical protein n=1 Tax=Micromonospora zamorensis TaxID=709883 RepID=UPI0036B965F2